MLSAHPRLVPVLLLIASNVFMTFAWYGHLRFRETSLLPVIFTSWGIALLEYFFAVPANRIGSRAYSLAELKAMQEVITLLVFAVFAYAYFGERISLVQGAGFACIALGAYLIFRGLPGG